VLPGLIALLAAVGLLLNGSWDLWAQSALLLALIAGSAMWLWVRLIVGYLPLPSSRTLAWAAGLATLSGLSAYLGPLPSYAVPAWRALLPALWIFVAISAVSKDARSHIDEAIRAVAWVLILLAFYQRFHYGMERPFASLLNQNVFAGAILLLLPLAAQKRDWILSVGLLLCLWWTKSVGAWLGLACALALTRRAGLAGLWAGGAVGFVCLVAIYGKIQSPEVLHRWEWWSAALGMAGDRPWLGFGPGTYAYLLSAYQDPGRQLASLFAHQYFLETAAQSGFPYVLLWGAGLIHWLRRGGPHKRCGALAVLVQSLWDYSLSIPAVLWLFSYFSASSIPESSRGVNVPARWKPPLCALVLAAAAAAAGAVSIQWRAERLRVSASALLLGQPGAGAEEEALRLLDRSFEAAPHPDAARLSAEIELRLARLEEEPAGAAGRLLAAAERLERSAQLNPYRATTWLILEDVYRRMGRQDLARRARAACGPLCRRNGRELSL
jgi:hypothetical protein